MADQPSVFGSDKTPTPEANIPGTTSKTPDSPVAILVGEGRKYKSHDDLAKAYLEADGFIERLKEENAALREKAAAAKTIDDVLSRIEQPKASAGDNSDRTNPSGLTADAIAKIVSDTVTGLETTKVRQSNMLKADAALKKLYGEKAKEVFDAQASTPETRAALMQLAQVDPDKFVKLFNPSASASGSQTDSGSSVNTAALADTNQSARVMDPNTKEYFDAMRKDPKRRKDYYSAAVQLAMHKAAQANPEKYFGRKIG
jgi:hypothetical protein